MPLDADATGSPSHGAGENARNAVEIIKRRISDVTQKKISDVCGLSVTTVNRIYNEERGIYLSELPGILAALDLSIIPAKDGETRTISKKEYEALRRLLHLYSEPED